MVSFFFQICIRIYTRKQIETYTYKRISQVSGILFLFFASFSVNGLKLNPICFMVVLARVRVSIQFIIVYTCVYMHSPSPGTCSLGQVWHL